MRIWLDPVVLRWERNVPILPVTLGLYAGSARAKVRLGWAIAAGKPVDRG
jgi:hypothetical protein